MAPANLFPLGATAWLLASLLGAAVGSGCAHHGSSPPSGPRTTAPTDAPSVVGEIWLPAALRVIAKREYHASTAVRGLQAPNRQHGLRSYFDAMGVRVYDRTSESSGPLVALSLSRVGRASGLRTPPPAVLTHDESRVELARGDALVEWYVNSPAGLEQGFTFRSRPLGEGPIVLDLAVAYAAVSASESVLEFDAASGRRLRFAKLECYDAEGQVLAARFAASPDGFRILVDDADARYPIVVDPLLTATYDAVLQSNQDFASFGTSVASVGDVNGDGYADVIVGDSFYDNGQNDEGAAFVFHGGPGGVGDGDPTSADTILESNQADAFFGQSVSAAGDVNGDGYDDVIVGAYLYDVTAVGDEGAAWIFHGGPTGIADGSPATSDTSLEGDQASGYFGWDVATAGDVDGDGYADVVVGAFQYDAGEPNEGAAFVYRGSAAGVPDGGPAAADAQLESNQPNAQMGYSVASAGDMNGDGYDEVVVGAVLFEGSSSFPDTGAAFTFFGSAAGIGDGGPGQADRIFSINSATGSGARIGEAVASVGDIDGDGRDEVAIGAPSYADRGAVFVDLGSGIRQLGPPEEGFRFGTSLGGPGDLNGDGYGDLTVGAPEASFGENGEGAVYVYLGRSGGPPSLGEEDFVLESDQSFANLGQSVASAGDVDGDGFDDLIAGAPFFEDGEMGEGHVFVYNGGGVGFSGSRGTHHALLESDQSDSLFGYSVASAGDVNGDGYGDVIVGSIYFDAGEDNEGAAFIFLGSAAGLMNGNPGTADAQLESDQSNSFFGISVASAGDVNGDGYGDVIVGANNFEAGEQSEGAAFVFLGSAAGIADGDPLTAHARLESNQETALLGDSVASAGDVNGDGFGDVIVGAPGFDAGEINEGAAFVFLGSAAGLTNGNPVTADAQLESDQLASNFGNVASAGDVNGDGFGDVVVGSRLFDAGEDDEGAAFIFLGGAAGIADGNPQTAHAQLESDQAGSGFGYRVASAGDVNGDGFGDVIVGAAQFVAVEDGEGAAFVFLGSSAGIGDGDAGTAHAQLESDQADSGFGYSVASAGDVNGDGFGDVIVGALNLGFDGGGAGMAFVFLGSAAGIADGNLATAHATVDRPPLSSIDEFGFSVASAGDVNGDGFGDVIVGAPRSEVGHPQEGVALVFLGNGAGRPLQLRQLRGDGSGIPVQPGGLTHAPGFEVAMQVTSPRGRERARLEIEVCPDSAPFGDVLCTHQISSDWVDLGLTGALFEETVAGPLPGTRFHWRARALYVPLSATELGIVPIARAGPWRQIAGGSGAATYIRSVPEPRGALSDFVACVTLIALARRRVKAPPPGP